MKTFDYSRADSPEAAVATGGRFIAGGTNLLDLMKLARKWRAASPTMRVRRRVCCVASLPLSSSACLAMLQSRRWCTGTIWSLLR